MKDHLLSKHNDKNGNFCCINDSHDKYKFIREKIRAQIRIWYRPFSLVFKSLLRESRLFQLIVEHLVYVCTHLHECVCKNKWVYVKF